MADNLTVTAGSGSTVAMDEVVDGTLGTVKVQYVKQMDGTLDGTTKLGVYAEDAAAAADPTGTMMMAVRRDTLSASEVSTDGDNIAVKATNKGQVHVYAQIDSTQLSALGQNTMTNSVSMAIASDQSAIPIVAKPSSTTNGSTTSRVNAAATTNATSLKGSAGNITEIDVFNTASYQVFLKFYNKATAPTLALATPVNAAFSTSTTGGTLPAGTYWYRVSALNANGETLVSAETSQATTGTTSTVTVNWGAVAGATGYKVYGRTTGAELLIATVGAVTTYTDTGAATPAGALPTANTTADTPSWTIPIPAGAGYSKTFPRGKSFSTGIAYAITKLQADTDATVLVAGDLTGSIDWI